MSAPGQTYLWWEKYIDTILKDIIGKFMRSSITTTRHVQIVVNSFLNQDDGGLFDSLYDSEIKSIEKDDYVGGQFQKEILVLQNALLYIGNTVVTSGKNKPILITEEQIISDARRRIRGGDDMDIRAWSLIVKRAFALHNAIVEREQQRREREREQREEEKEKQREEEEKQREKQREEAKRKREESKEQHGKKQRTETVQPPEYFDTYTRYTLPNEDKIDVPLDELERNKAYKDLMVKYHPDKHPEEQELYTSLTQRINSIFDMYKRGGKTIKKHKSKKSMHKSKKSSHKSSHKSKHRNKPKKSHKKK